MQIINATTKVRSVMADNGTNFQILPGQVSEPMVATKQLIIAATQLGNNREIGIVTGGSWEFEIAKTIPVAAPYLYTDLDEAKAKLIDPSKDYTAKARNTADLLVKQQLLDRTKELTEANKLIDTLKKQLENVNTNELVTKLNAVIAEKTTQAETLSKRIAELERQLKSANENEQALRLELSQANTNYSKANTSLEALRKEHANVIAQAEQYKADLEKLPSLDKISAMQDQVLAAQKSAADKDLEIAELKKQIAAMPSAESVEQNQTEVAELREEIVGKDKQIVELKDALTSSISDIEKMKASFNEACVKFKLTKDESGEWIQLP